MGIERRREQQPEFTFDADPTIIAERIKGAQLMIDGKTVVIAGAVEFSREENEKRQYQEIAKQKPGTMMGIPFMMHTLAVVTTEGGSCITINAVEVTNEGKSQLVCGSGRVGKLLGLEKGEIRNIQVDDPQAKIFKAIRPQATS